MGVSYEHEARARLLILVFHELLAHRRILLPSFKLLNREVSRFRMMDDDSRSRLLGIELKLFGQFNIDARRIEQIEKLRLVFQIRDTPDNQS